jgi:thioesterase domain-containing protein
MENKNNEKGPENRDRKNHRRNSKYRGNRRRKSGNFNRDGKNRDNPCGWLFNYIRENFALMRGIRFNILAYDGNSLVFSAPLSGNENDIGAMFTGSMYAISQLAAQGIILLKNREKKIDVKLDIARATIRFNSPVTDYIHIRCTVTEKQWNKYFKQLEKGGHAKLAVEVAVFEKENPDVNCSLLKAEIVAWKKLKQ